MRFLILFVSISTLQAQIIVDTFAGGKILSGVPAQRVLLQTLRSVGWDNAGNLVFCDDTNNVIRRVRTDGTVETIAGSGITGFSGDGGPATTATLNSQSGRATTRLGISISSTQRITVFGASRPRLTSTEFPQTGPSRHS